LLTDNEWSAWSDREIARQCAVSQPFVSKLRLSVTDNVISKRVYQTKHGAVTTMDTSGIGSGLLPNEDSDAAQYTPLYVAARRALMEAAAGIGHGSIENDLALFDAARTALGEARRVDEVADIPEKAVRMGCTLFRPKTQHLLGRQSRSSYEWRGGSANCSRPRTKLRLRSRMPAAEAANEHAARRNRSPIAGAQHCPLFSGVPR
jgi:hypothetical protein